MCKCIEKMDEVLAKANTRIALAMGISVMRGSKSSVDVRPMVVTVKVDEKKRGRPKTALASFCPFCGTKITV